MQLRFLFLLAAASVFLTSCHPGTQVEIVNNSGESLIVISMNNQMKETTYPIGIGQTSRIRVPYKLRIQRAGKGDWDYDLPPKPLPPNFRARIAGNRYLERYQIEKNGAIHVLPPNGQGAVNELPTQPSGFPLQPTK